MDAFLNLPRLLASGNTPLIMSLGPRGMLVWALAPAIVGALLYFIGRRINVPAVRWGSFLPLLFGLVLGVTSIQNLSDPIYKDFYDISSKRANLHYAAAALPLIVGIGLLALELVTKNSARNRL